jgi:hypothetical protein
VPDLPPHLQPKGIIAMNKSFGKLYAKTFTGSMFGAGPGRYAVWSYCIANALPPEGIVELNPQLLAPMIGMTEQDVAEAIDYLCSPDPRSRTPDDEGRRLRHVAAFEYRLVNFVAHRNGTDDDARRAYWAERQRAHRAAASNHVKRSVIDSQGQSLKQSTEGRSKKRKDIGASESRPTSAETIIESLKSNPAYAGIDVEREFHKCLTWCQANRKQATHRRFVNWLNRADPPATALPAKRPAKMLSDGSVDPTSI